MTDASSQRALDRLLRLLALDQLDRDLFVGETGEGQYRLFGGLVAAQSVVAACRTVEAGDAALHSLHAYFLRPGRYGTPIRYVVQRIRDGRTFTTRDVVAYQAGEAIFNLSCSFAKPEPGASRGAPAPTVPPPDDLPAWTFGPEAPGGRATEIERFHRDSPVDVRSIDRVQPPPGDIPRRRVWVGARGVLPEDPVLHAGLLTFASDMGLIATAHLPPPGATEEAWQPGSWASASLDHAIWFHRPPRFDGWVLYTSESPIAHAARALIFGQMYRQDGTRIASVVQESLIRYSRPSPAR
ncbi:MAG: thioesterase family protein [Dehalococcoidia bacterium]|nr:thioesterase family protein [Dehalococcoidia bacterium]